MTLFFINNAKTLANNKNEALSKKVQDALDKNALQDKTTNELSTKVVTIQNFYFSFMYHLFYCSTSNANRIRP